MEIGELLGRPAPAFSALDQEGTLRTLEEFKGGWVLLYFYPKDDTPGCTKEACGLRDQFAELSQYLTIIGVSADSVTSHKKFAEKYHLPFLLLSDSEKTIVNAYTVWREKTMALKKYFGIVRTSFLIDPSGRIAKIYDKVKPEEHAEEILGDLRELLKN